MMLEFYDIVKYDDIQVSIPQTSHFTIGTSPYYAHQHGLAIDIYQSLSLENYEVLSPIMGSVKEIKTLRAPKPKFLGGIDKDYLILVKNREEHETVYKIMHVKPNVQVGDQIEIGDPLGNTIRNGYFAYWSSPHLHLEIRPSKDAIRARGGKAFPLALKSKNPIKIAKNKTSSGIPIEIHSLFPEYLLGRFPKEMYFRMEPIYGVRSNVNKQTCLLDGGIPHYKFGTIICQTNSNFKLNNSVYFEDKEIGNLHESRGQFGFFRFKPSVKLYLNNKEIRGISLFLANFLPLIKIIPYKMNEFSFKSKSIQYLTIES